MSACGDKSNRDLLNFCRFRHDTKARLYCGENFRRTSEEQEKTIKISDIKEGLSHLLV